MIVRVGKGAGVGITGLGTHVPDRVLTNAEIARMVETSDEWIVTRTGIRERRIAEPDQATSDLTIPAARDALGGARDWAAWAGVDGSHDNGRRRSHVGLDDCALECPRGSLR